MDASATELDTFKIMSNSDTVDWSRTLAAPRGVEDEEEWGGVLSHEPEVLLAQPSVRIVAPAPLEVRQDPPVMEEDRVEQERRSATPPKVRRSYTPPLPPSPPRETRETHETRGDPRGNPSEQSDEAPRPAAPKRAVRAPIRYTAAEENEDYEIRMEKEALLNEILAFARPPQNFKLTREWSVTEHTLNELQFELDRINSEINATGIVDMAKSGIKFGVSGLEMFLKQQGLDAADGWYNNSCRDMSKYNRPLNRLYKKYWRNSQLSPMMELGYLLGGSLAWTIAENKMGFRKSSAPAPSVAPEIPRATSFEAPGRMRPPSSSFAPPKWASAAAEASTNSAQAQATSTQATPAHAAAAQATAAQATAAQFPQAQAPQPPAQSVSEELLGKLSSQNDLMIQLLQGLATSRAPIPASPKSAATSPNIRVKGFMPSGRKSARTPHIVKRTNQEEETLSL